MRVSVILCTYSMDRYSDFSEAANSVLNQTYNNVELVVVVDGTDAVYERATDDYGEKENVILHCNEQNRGLSDSRNNGVELATGDVVAFIDDDAVADSKWIAGLIDTYKRCGALAVGGKMTPAWVAGKPNYLPAEFYWLVGVTYRGFAEEVTEVRNTFSSNLSFRREVMLDLGGFQSNMGKQGSNDLQGAETELCARMREEHGRGVVYNPEAMVAHKVFDYRTEPAWLVERAFWQGYSKQVMQTVRPGSTDRESKFLFQLISEFIPERTKRLVNRPSIPNLLQLIMIAILTSAVGAGYGYAVLNRAV